MQDKTLKIDGKLLALSNLDKVFWPREGFTKGDLIEYYHTVAKYMLPHLAGRPESMNRFPDGITGESFYQKNIEIEPKWVKTYLEIAGDGHQVSYAIVNDTASLLYLANLGCIEMNVWNSRITSPEKPDFLVIDLDPVEVDFSEVRKVALTVKDIFDLLGLKSYPKISGKRGLHIYVPAGARYSYDQIRNFAHLVVLKVHERLPKITSLERMPKNRQGKVYLDFLQNRKEATMAAPYSVRPVPGAQVSAPVTWEELKKGAKPADFTIKNMPKRLERIGDIMKPVLEKGIDLPKALQKIAEL